MRFMGLLRADAESEAGAPPSPELMARMGTFLEDVTKAGVLLGTDGLHPSSRGARVRLANGKVTVTDGPFTESKELVASYALLQVKSKEEAIEWIKRSPNPFPGADAEIEIRQLFEAEDFGAELTPELRDREERLRARLAAQQ